MKRGSLSVRLAVSVGALGMALVGLVFAFSYLTLSHQLDNQAAEHLRGKLKQVAHVMSEEPDAEAIGKDAHRLIDLLIGHDELHIAIARSGPGNVLATFSLIGRESISRVASGTESDRYLDWRSEGGTRLLSLAARAESRNQDEVLVVVTVDRAGDDRLLSGFIRIALLSLPVAIALVVAGAWWITSRGLWPLMRLREAAASVTTRDLGYRLADGGLPLELSELASAFNLMLERLEDGVSRLLQFSGDLAHEIRTPISNLLGKAQVTLSKARSADEYRVALESSVEELERISRLVDDLLFLAQADRANGALHPERVDLRVEVARVAEFFEVVADEKGATFDILGEGEVRADRLMVQRAIANLMSNAIRHSSNGGKVTIKLDNCAAGRVCLDISNHGADIPPEHLAHVFERFYRADLSRARIEGGAALGLAIVKSIMKLHGGEAGIESKDHVTRVRLGFPIGSQADFSNQAKAG